MTPHAASRGKGDIADAAGLIAGLVNRGLVREAEVGIALLALWVLEQVQKGQMARERADAIFTALDVEIGGLAGAALLSETSHDLVIEGEHFHHFGEEWGPDPDHLRALAEAVLTHGQIPLTTRGHGSP